MRDEENFLEEYDDSIEIESTEKEPIETNLQYENSSAWHQETERPSQALGIAAMILGILSLVLFCSCINIPMAFVAIGLGIAHLLTPGSNKGTAIAGIITSCLSIIMLILFVVMFMITANVTESELSNTLEMYEMYEEYEDLGDFELDLDDTF